MKKNLLKNRIKLRIKGFNQERIFNQLSKEFKFFNIKRKDRQNCEFEVESKNAKKVKQALISAGFEVEVVWTTGLSKIAKNTLKSYGIITALLLCIVFYFVQFNHIWRIDVYGTENLNKNEISAYISENFPLDKSKIDTKVLENQLKSRFFPISSVSVAVIGQSLIVNIYEKVLPDEMNDFSPIYSNFDGRITSTNLVQGTLAVKVGQIVRKGDILVQPYIIDSQGQRRDVNPQAEIFADVWLSGESNHCENYLKTYRTGKSIVIEKITLFGLEIYNNDKDVQFSTFDLEEESFLLSKNNILPLVLQKKTYFETETKMFEVPFEQIKEQKIEEAKQKALIYLQEYDIIKNEDYVISEAAGNYKITYLVTANRQIGVKNENLL